MTKIKDVKYNGHVYIIRDNTGTHIFNDYTDAKTHIDGLCDAA